MSKQVMQQALGALYNMVADGDKTDKQQALVAINALCEAIEALKAAQPVEPARCEFCTDLIPPPESEPAQHHDLKSQLEDLHLYEEIAEHYAKCVISPEALRDWVAERMDKTAPAAPYQVTNEEAQAVRAAYYSNPGTSVEAMRAALEAHEARKAAA